MVHPPPRRRLRPEQRRELILAAAGRCFGERGYDGTRLDAVAAAAGVTKPVLYRHFADKTALYLALLERHRRDLGSFSAALPPEGDLEQRVRAVIELWLDYVAGHAFAWTLLFRDRGGGPAVEAVRAEVKAEARATLAGLIRALAARPIPEREIEPLAEMLRMGMASLALLWLDDPALDRDAMAAAITRVWAGVLRG